MRFALVFGFFLIATWMRDNPVPMWLVGVFSVLFMMDALEWLFSMSRDFSIMKLADKHLKREQ
jgi:hypothetical protein